MKKHLAKITAILLILTFSVGLFTGCNGSSVLPTDKQGDYYDEKDDDGKNNRKKETSETDDDDIRIAQDDPVIPDLDDDDNSNEPADTKDTDDSDDAAEPEETDATEDTSPTEKPIGKTKVSNAYKKSFKTKYLGKVTSSYPKVTIEGVDTSAVNKEIKKDIDSKAKKHKVTYK